jgi:hypothetical protein
MVTPRDYTRDGAGGVTAESVGDDPLALEQNFAGSLGRVPLHCPHDGWGVRDVHS